MKYVTLLLPVWLAFSCCSCHTGSSSLEKLIDNQLAYAAEKYSAMDKSLPDSLFPRSWNMEKNCLVTSGSDWWSSGFYPGSMWMLYSHFSDPDLREIAERRTWQIAEEQYNRGTHDLGFMLNNSFGKAYAITMDTVYLDVLFNGAKSLSSRFNPKTGLIKSWDNRKWQYPVIIDNMMNLEYLCQVSRLTGEESYLEIARSHADRTIEDHFRNDYSSYHLVDYDTLTGAVLRKQTVQGYADSSVWARGQAWGLYGFTSMYRETGDSAYLEQALHIARFILNNPALPDDLVPYWDYSAPGIPDAPRDVSAAAITASAFIELASYAQTQESKDLLSAAGKILCALSSPPYINNEGKYGNFILLHSVGHLPDASEVDVPLSYADYYYIEALLRMKAVLSD